MSEAKHIPTPRTDAGTFEVRSGTPLPDRVVYASLARGLEEELHKARLALSAASSALGPMEALENPDLRALKAQIEENL